MSGLPMHFRLIRDNDVSGVSGTGHVADGVIFSDGHAAVHWLGRWPTTTPHPEGLASVEGIHSHNGATRIEYLNEPTHRWMYILADLDRCVHGRHIGDPCGGSCGTVSQGNPHMRTGDVIGYDIRGNEIVMPDRNGKHKPEAWRKR